MVLKDTLIEAVAKGASDVFIVAGQPISFKISGQIVPQDDYKLKATDTAATIHAIYEMGHRDMTPFLESGDDDFSFSIPGESRFRVSTYRQRDSLAAVIRMIPFGIPSYEKLGISEEVMKMAARKKGLVLVTGTAGSGKSTTLACMVDRINNTRNAHIITLEEPIEYLHRNIKSTISQREVGVDTKNYLTALRACLRQAPDVILVGEMRDFETIRTAMTAAETGHLVISSLHTVGAANTVDRIIDVFPPNQQQQIRVQLAMLLQAVVSQQLIPALDGSLVCAFEIMNTNNAIKNIIREAKLHQMDSIISTSASEGMITMDTSILDLYKQGLISAENAIQYAVNPETMAKRVKG